MPSQKPLRLTLEFDTKAGLQAFLDRHSFIGGIVTCQPAPSPSLPPVAALAVQSGVLDTDTWVFDLTGTMDPEGDLGSVTLAWGDGSADTAVALSGGAIVDVHVLHDWPAGGDTYTVTLTVIDGSGLSQTATIQADVDVVENPANQLPLAALTFVSGEFTGSPVVLSTAGTTDPDGTIASYSMDWDDGAPDAAATPPPDPVDHTYATPGTYAAVLTVTDNDGGVGTVEMEIIVAAPAAGDPPDTTFTLESGSELGDSFVFALDGSDPDLGAVTWTLNFGDGSALVTGSALPTTESRIYLAVGNYSAVFRVTDVEGLTTTKTIAVTVALPDEPDPVPANQSPIPSLALVSGQFVGDTITLNTTGTVDLDGSIASWSIDWDDGQPNTGATGQPPLFPTRPALAAGTQTVVLTVTDNGTPAKSGVATLTVSIEDVAPPLNRPPTASLTKTTGTVLGDTFTFALAGADPDGGGITWELDFGDGSTKPTGSTLPTTRSRTYATAGNYTARLKVTDTTNLTTTATLGVTVFVAPDPPAPGDYPYFDLLASRDDRLYLWPLRSQAEIDTYETGGQWAPAESMFYDPVVDALQQNIHPGVVLGPSGRVGTGNSPRQKFLPMVMSFGTSFLQTWDARYTSGFAWLGATYLKGYKAYRWDLPQGGGTPAWIAQNDSWQTGSVHAALGWRFVKVPTNPYWALPPTTVGAQESIQPQTPFYEQADRWIRSWIYYDAPNQQLSAWMADSVQGIVQCLNKAPYAFPSVGIVRFRLEYDTSQNTVDVANPFSQIWNRNIVVLHGLNYATAASLLSVEGL